MSAYCTASDVATAAGKYQGLSPAETTVATAAIPQAQEMVEKATGTFFDQRHLKVTTEAVQSRQTKIFLPAPIISIDNNTILEAGVTLTLGTDFLLYQPNLNGIPTGPGWLEKLNSAFSSWNGFRGVPAWTNVQQGIVVAGQYGYAAVPMDIVKLTAYQTARILGWITIDYTDGAGMTQTVVKNALPDWAKETQNSRRVSYIDEQSFQIVTLT